MSFKNSRRVNLEIQLNDNGQLEFLVTQINELHSKVEENYAKARQYYSEALLNAKELGGLLLDAKALVKHGEWENWCEDNLTFKMTSAKTYIRIFSHWDLIANTNPMPLLESEEKDVVNRQETADLPVPQKTLEEAKQKIKEFLEKEKQEAIDTAIKLIETTNTSDREIAEQVRLTHPTIAKLRKQFEATSEVQKEREQLALDLLKANCQVNDAKYKMEMIDRERAVLKLEAANAKKFKQQYEETYQEKRLTENHLRSTTKKLEETERQLERFQKELENEKHKAVKEYINQHLAELEQKKADLELEIEWKQAEIVQKNEELSQFKNSKIDEVMLRQMLAKFAEITAELSENQFNLINVEADYVPEFKGIIVQLKTWVAILEDAISEG